MVEKRKALDRADGAIGRWLADQRPVIHRRRAQADPEQGVEGRSVMAPPVPAEHEFIEIGLDMSFAEPVIDAEAEALQIREDAVYPRQEHMRRHRPDDFGLVIAIVHAGIGRKAIGEDGRA